MNTFKMRIARVVTEPKLILSYTLNKLSRIKRIPGKITKKLKENKRYFTEKRNYDCSKLRVAVINYCNEIVNFEAHCQRLVDKLNDIEVEYVYSYKPDVVFCHVYGNKRKIDKYKKAAKIFSTGEPPNEFIYTQYNGYHNEGNGYDISAGFRFETEHTAANYMRLPLGVLYHFRLNYTKEQISEKISEFEMTARRYGDNRSKFCAMINSHDTFQTREKIYHAVQQVSRVDCPGKLYHNDKQYKNGLPYGNKIDYLRQYRFNICGESIITEGFCSEKIFDALYAGCIPIYTGGDNVDPEPGVLNPEKIIFFNHENIDDSVMSRVKELHENAREYKAWIDRPIFCDTATDVIHTMFTRYNEMLAKLADVLAEKVKKRAALS